MGLFSVGCKVENHADPKKSAVIPKLLVDAGSEYTWIEEKVLDRIGIVPRKQDSQILLANGQIRASRARFMEQIRKSKTCISIIAEF